MVLCPTPDDSKAREEDNPMSNDIIENTESTETIITNQETHVLTDDTELQEGEAQEMAGEHYKGDVNDEALRQATEDAAYEEAFAAELEAESRAIDQGTSTEDEAVANLMATIDAHDEGVILGTQAEMLPDVKPTKTKTVEPKGPPAYEAFVAAVGAHAKALGLSVKEQKSFFQFWAPSGHKLYIEKALKKGVSRIDTSLPRTALVVNGKDISLPLSKPNGRIACHVDPSIESVKQALEVLATFESKIPAPKKPATKEQTAA